MTIGREVLQTSSSDGHCGTGSPRGTVPDQRHTAPAQVDSATSHETADHEHEGARDLRDTQT